MKDECVTVCDCCDKPIYEGDEHQCFDVEDGAWCQHDECGGGDG